LAAVRLTVPEEGASGVIIASGGSSAVFALCLEDGVPVHGYDFFGRARYRVDAPEALPAGSHTIERVAIEFQ